MTPLLDAALAILILTAALFLGTVGIALFKTLTEKEKKDDNSQPPVSK